MSRTDALVRVLVVDDSEAARAALAAVVAATNGFTVVGDSGSGEEALYMVPRLDPDLVLLDVHMPGLSGKRTAHQISENYPGTVVVLVSAALSAVAESAEVAAFLPKDEVSPQSLRDVWAATRSQAAAQRTAARRLREEAQALQAQAAHQVRRARRIQQRSRE